MVSKFHSWKDFLQVKLHDSLVFEVIDVIIFVLLVIRCRHCEELMERRLFLSILDEWNLERLLSIPLQQIIVEFGHVRVAAKDVKNGLSLGENHQSNIFTHTLRQSAELRVWQFLRVNPVLLDSVLHFKLDDKPKEREWSLIDWLIYSFTVEVHSELLVCLFFLAWLDLLVLGIKTHTLDAIESSVRSHEPLCII